MKILLIVVMLVSVLWGCAAQPVYETVGDGWELSEPAVSPGRMEVPLPEGAELEVMDSFGAGFYRVGNWELWTEILDGGNLHGTLQTLSGLDGEMLTVLARSLDGFNCSETTWTTTSDEGTKVVRAGILDDGNFHYCICLGAPAEEAEEAGEVFSQVLKTVRITDIAP